MEFVNKSEGHHEVNAECAAVFEQLKLRRKHRYIIYKIGSTEIEVETIGERGATYEEFKSKLPFTDSRYGKLRKIFLILPISYYASTVFLIIC